MPKTSLLFTPEAGWKISNLPASFGNWTDPRCGHPDGMSSLNPNKKFSTVHAYVAKAIEAYTAKNTDLALVKVGTGSYASEATLSDGTSLVFTIAQNGKCRAAAVDSTGRFQTLPSIGSKSNDTDHSLIFLCLLPLLAEKDSETAEALDKIEEEYLRDKTWNQHAIFRVCDAMYHGLNAELIKVNLTAGNIDLLPDKTVMTGSLSGTTVCGMPKILAGGSGKAKSSQKRLTMKEAKIEFQAWASQQNWTEEEVDLIPVFPDDYPVPPEAIKIAKRFVNTRGDRRPMNNFMWRGITSYGKSTGVEIMASFLNMPLLRVTCHSTMETQQFLSDFVPDNGTVELARDLPSFEEMAYDPEFAYQKLTGKDEPEATPEMCLEAYGAVIASRSNSGARFKHVESNFVKALSRGYIVEIQEISRIKDSGVLVGLNEFDRPGAVIPLVDGGFVRRHPNAMCLYTDNVGYASCRPVDPSVIRRMAFIIDSNELPKKDAIARIVYNTGFSDKALLEQMYTVWHEVDLFCKDRDITEGSVSVTEIEMWCQAVQADGMTNVWENCIDCVVSKATSDPDEQKEIISSVLQIHLGDYATVSIA